VQSGARVGWDALSPPGDEPVRTNERGASVRKSIGLAETPVRIAEIAAHTKNIEGHVPEFPRNNCGSATPVLAATWPREEYEVSEEVV